MKKYQLVLLSVLSGVLLSLAWPARGFPLLLMAAWIPVLWVEDHILDRQRKGDLHNGTLFFTTYPCFFIWNLLTTWWIYNSTGIGAALAILLNAFFMTLVFLLFHLTRKAFTNVLPGYLSLVVYWITFENIHNHWEISWPWLHLGNGFAAYPKWIQWYEFTGIFGGTLWILVSNILLFLVFKELYTARRFIVPAQVKAIFVLVWIVTPILISVWMYKHYQEKSDPVDVVIVQPNLDPYTEQYGLGVDSVLKRTLALSDAIADNATDFVVCPESALQEHPLFESEFTRSKSYRYLAAYVREHPERFLMIGASTYKMFEPGEPLTHTARQFGDSDRYYDAFNTAILMQPDMNYQLYHKSKLTPGVEIMPYAKYLRFIEGLAINLGGTVGSLGTDKERRPYDIPLKNLRIAPVICYESAYGEFCSRYVRNGARLIFVITNDGWWGKTPGHRQHLTFSSLRAIETRRSIARSANTGISAFINQRGDVQQATPYWIETAIRQEINANNEITFYVRYGDYLARIAVYISVLLLLITLTVKLIKRTGNIKQPLT
ncbi:MAG: apolipoprotein N-acyltransferase [Bacteroidales bacterium]|nr:apolipoprotein N-acyltransferase [Lentimicrobiaceae bacterium]MDD5694228.1 apolipoprotein N-acyltransferase [Bacteroidales bacterium]